MAQSLAVELSLRSALREASRVRLAMTRGVDTLAHIVRVAPWIGIVGTCTEMASFRSAGGNRDFAFIIIADWMSDVILPTALGLLVALLVLAIHKFLVAQQEAIDLEMRTAAYDLPAHLNRLPTVVI